MSWALLLSPGVPSTESKIVAIETSAASASQIPSVVGLVSVFPSVAIRLAENPANFPGCIDPDPLFTPDFDLTSTYPCVDVEDNSKITPGQPPRPRPTRSRRFPDRALLVIDTGAGWRVGGIGDSVGR